MTQSVAEIAEDINRSVPRLKSGSLVVFGDIFGGRIDNIHTVVAARAESLPERLVIVFDHDEVLMVWDPSDVLADMDDFRISNASRVRWEWVYYGRADSPENRLFVEHKMVDGQVIATTNAPWGGSSLSPSAVLPAVELVSFADQRH